MAKLSITREPEYRIPPYTAVTLKRWPRFVRWVRRKIGFPVKHEIRMGEITPIKGQDKPRVIGRVIKSYEKGEYPIVTIIVGDTGDDQ